MTEPVHAQGGPFGAVMDVVTSPFRMLRGHSRRPDFVRPRVNITPPLFRSTRPATTKRARAARKTILARRKAAMDRVAERQRPGAVPAGAGPAAAAAPAAAALPGAAARPASPDTAVPAGAGSQPEQGAAAPQQGAAAPRQSAAAPRGPAGAARQSEQDRRAQRTPAVASWVGPLYWPYA